MELKNGLNINVMHNVEPLHEAMLLLIVKITKHIRTAKAEVSGSNETEP